MVGKTLCYNAECPFIDKIPHECGCVALCNRYTAFASKIVASDRTEMSEGSGGYSTHTTLNEKN